MATYMVGVFGIVLASCVLSSLAQTNNSEALIIPLKNHSAVLTFEPSLKEGLIVGETAKVHYQVELVPLPPSSSPQETNIQTQNVKVYIQSRDSYVASVESPAELILSPHNESISRGNSSFITIKGHFLGRTVLTFSVSDAVMDELKYDSAETNAAAYTASWSGKLTPSPASISSREGPVIQNTTGANSPYTQTVVYMRKEAGEKLHHFDFEYHISVVRPHRSVDKIFIAVIVIIVLLANVGMGCKIDFQVIKEVTRRPVAPAIGMSCQYIVMPLLSFAIIKMLGLQSGVALGMFATGCAPGGGASNMYAFLLKGDVSLSVTMTFFSTMAALGLIPLWLFTLGRVILGEDSRRIVIPYENMVYSLLLLLIPVAVGILIQRFKPTWSKYVLKTLRPVFCFFIVFIFTFGVYVNLFIFRLFTPALVAAGILLPYLGFTLGGLVAFACRQNWARIKTIAVETGIQNTGVAFLVVTFTLPQPEADLAMVSPIIVATFTPIPLLIAIALIEYRDRCSSKATKLPPTAVKEEEEEVATFDQTEQKVALNGGSEARQSDMSQATEYPLLDDTQNTALTTA